MTLADAYHWTPDQVDALDPEFVLELLSQRAALADYETLQAELTPEQREQQAKARISTRKAQIMKRRQPEAPRRGR